MRHGKGFDGPWIGARRGLSERKGGNGIAPGQRWHESFTHCWRRVPQEGPHAE